MTDELTARLENQDVLIAQLTRRVKALETQATQAPAAPANGASANGKRPRWLDFVKFGDKPCAGGCGAIVPAGRTIAWYEPAAHGTKAALYCQPCGKPREKAGA